MANTITDPYMGFLNPVPGVDPGPDWALNISSALAVIGAHNHSPGNGNLITTNGLNINLDLTLNSNNLIGVRSTRYIPNVSTLAGVSDLGCVYISGGNLYYNNASGTPVQITSGNSIVGTAGSINGLPSGTASANYAAGVFSFQSATNTAATIDGASYILRNNTASSKGLTLSPPAAMASDFSLVLPSIPGSTSFAQLDNSGNFSASIPVSLGITASNIANQTITQIKKAVMATGSTVAAGGFATSSASSASYSYTGSTVTQGVTGLSVTITTTGRPVFVSLASIGSTQGRVTYLNTNVSGYQAGVLSFVRGASVISVHAVGSTENTGVIYTSYPTGSFNCFDAVAAGTYTYAVTINITDAANTIFVQDVWLIAYEI